MQNILKAVYRAPSLADVTLEYCIRYHNGSDDSCENTIAVCADSGTYLRGVDILKGNGGLYGNFPS